MWCQWWRPTAIGAFLPSSTTSRSAPIHSFNLI
jgi:hypothetical protein